MTQSQISLENELDDSGEDGIDELSLQTYVLSHDMQQQIRTYGKHVKKQLGHCLKAIHIMPNVGFVEYKKKHFLNGVVFEIEPTTLAKTILPFLLPLYQYRKIMVVNDLFKKTPDFEKDWKALAESMDISDSASDSIHIRKIIADIERSKNEKGQIHITEQLFERESDVYCDKIVEKMAEKEKLMDKFDLGLESISLAGVYGLNESCVTATTLAVSGGNHCVENNLRYLMSDFQLTMEDFAHNITTSNKFINIIKKLKDIQVRNNEKLMDAIIKLLEKHGLPAIRTMIKDGRVETQTAFFNTVQMKNSTCYITQGCYDLHCANTTPNKSYTSYYFLNNDACYQLNVQTPLFTDNDCVPIDTGSCICKKDLDFTDVESTVLTNMKNINVTWAGKSNISFFHYRKQNPFPLFMNQLALMRKGSLYNQYSVYHNIACFCGEIDLKNVTLEDMLWITFTKPDDFVIKIRFNDVIYAKLHEALALQDDLKENVCFSLHDNMLNIRLAFLRYIHHSEANHILFCGTRPYGQNIQ